MNEVAKPGKVVNVYPAYQKKIISYLDGSLSLSEKAEFEAFVQTHPDFAVQVKSRQDEMNLIKTLIPVARLSRAESESLDHEVRLSVFHLLKEEPKNFVDNIKLRWEEWVNR